MPSGGRSTVVDVTYADPRTGERFRERRVQELPDDEVEDVRRRELAMVLSPPSRDDQDVYYDRRRDYDNDFQPSPRGRRNDDFLAVSEYRPQRARSYRGAESRRRRNNSSSSQSSSDSENDRRSRRPRDRRRARSARPDVERDANDDDDEGILWYSGKPRKDCNFFERNFDSSYDGLLTAAAGAAIGAMTARRFAHKQGEEDKHKNWKTLGGAVVGAGLFNVAENHYRVYTEEKIERRADDKVEGRRERRRED